MSEPTAVATPAGTPRTSRFKEPGEGSSVLISVVTVIGLIVLWFVVTNAGWIKPLFLPKPQTVAAQFWDYLTGTSTTSRCGSTSSPACCA